MAKKPAAKKSAPKKVSKTARATQTKATRAAGKAGKTKRSRSVSAPTPEPSAAARARRERSRQALQLYETGIAAMQRRDFGSAERSLREVVDDYPDERELHERARLYLKVCEREAAPPQQAPVSPSERTYAATLALNAGAVDDALRHLDAAAAEAPDSDHVQYMLAVARALAGDTEASVAHLERAIALNPDNRLLARQEPDFERLRDDERFERVVASRGSGRAGRA